jgi:non-heme chloroperoxidase
MARTHTIAGGAGLRLHVREWGEHTAPPLLFVHGWSQSHLSWSHQWSGGLEDEFRVVALDLRGHGLSEKPMGTGPYTDAQLWADDIAAVIRELALDRPVLVGWSYGGLVLSDYVRAYGEAAISGLHYVAAAVMLKPGTPHIGPGFNDHAAGATSASLSDNIRAMRGFVSACTARPMSPEDRETALCFNMLVPARVRAALTEREVDSDDVLRSLTAPVLVAQGEADRVVLPSMARHILGVCPNAQASWYPDVGHAPFLEDPDRFNQELAAFARRARTGSGRAP